MRISTPGESGVQNNLPLPQAGQLLALARQAVHGVAVDASAFAIEVRKQLSDDDRSALVSPDVSDAVDAPLLQRVGPAQDVRGIQFELYIARLEFETIRMYGLVMVKGMPGLHRIHRGR